MSTRIIIALLILAGIIAAVRYDKKEAIAPTPTPVVCTQDALQCPDGSYVGRVAPECQFAQCPKDKVVEPPIPAPTGIVSGIVTTSPSCGIQMDPPNPNCGPKPYQTAIVFTGAGNTVYKVNSGTDGKYSLKLPIGSYKVQAQGGQYLPSCPPETVAVQANKTVTKDIDCDSGIR